MTAVAWHTAMEQAARTACTLWDGMMGRLPEPGALVAVWHLYEAPPGVPGRMQYGPAQPPDCVVRHEAGGGWVRVQPAAPVRHLGQAWWTV